MTQAEFMDWAENTVLEYLATHGPFHGLEETTFHLNDIFIVWYCKTLQNHKALLGSTAVAGAYFEFTYNGDKDEAYLDVYGKHENIVCRRLEDE